MPENVRNRKRSFDNRGWYWINKEILIKYGKQIKSSGIAVYNVLASYANQGTQTCFPAQQTIAEMIGLHRVTVNHKIKQLNRLGLIEIKKRKNGCLYSLLSAGVAYPLQSCNKSYTRDVASDNMNNNKLTRNINNIDSDNKKFFLDSPSYKDIKLETKEDLLALDTAEALNDLKSLPLYLKYAHQVPEYVIREALSWIKMIPSENIKKSRAALFNYIIQKYVKENLKDHGN